MWGRRSFSTPRATCWRPDRLAKKRRKAKAKVRGRKRKSPGESEGVRVALKYLVETYGCQMNVHDSERIAGLLEQAGYEAAADAADADVVVINTCSVREHAED